jgi:hypothetical protein
MFQMSRLRLKDTEKNGPRKRWPIPQGFTVKQASVTSISAAYKAIRKIKLVTLTGHWVQLPGVIAPTGQIKLNVILRRADDCELGEGEADKGVITYRLEGYKPESPNSALYIDAIVYVQPETGSILNWEVTAYPVGSTPKESLLYELWWRTRRRT